MLKGRQYSNGTRHAVTTHFVVIAESCIDSTSSEVIRRTAHAVKHGPLLLHNCTEATVMRRREAYSPCYLQLSRIRGVLMPGWLAAGTKDRRNLGHFLTGWHKADPASAEEKPSHTTQGAVISLFSMGLFCRLGFADQVPCVSSLPRVWSASGTGAKGANHSADLTPSLQDARVLPRGCAQISSELA
jgi:hypothetical protein